LDPKTTVQDIYVAIFELPTQPCYSSFYLSYNGAKLLSSSDLMTICGEAADVQFELHPGKKL